MRKLFGKIHLWLSIPVGIILSIICFSGAALVFEKEITQACKPHLYKVSVPEGNAAVLPPSQLIARIKEQTADSLKLTSLQYSGKADEAATVTFKNAGRKSLSVNPYTGEVNGWIEGNAFFQTMRKLHRWLLNPPPQKGASSVGKNGRHGSDRIVRQSQCQYSIGSFVVGYRSCFRQWRRQYSTVFHRKALLHW